MDGYGIQIYLRDRGSQRYRTDSGETSAWELTDAEALAFNLLHGKHGRAEYVMFGNGEHEFWLWAEGIDDPTSGRFDHPNNRWAAWYVDVEIAGHRWRYAPMAGMDDEVAADGVAERVLDDLAPPVTHMWVGASDGSEEHDGPTEV